jgi:hypothetical protein
VYTCSSRREVDGQASQRLELKFKKVGEKQARKVRAARDIEQLQALFRSASDADTLDEVLALLRDH